jgi:hypothetical protein
LDGVVDSVGTARYAPLVEVVDDDWDWTFGMVLRHAFLVVDGGATCRYPYALARVGSGS